MTTFPWLCCWLQSWTFSNTSTDFIPDGEAIVRQRKGSPKIMLNVGGERQTCKQWLRMLRMENTILGESYLKLSHIRRLDNLLPKLGILSAKTFNSSSNNGFVESVLMSGGLNLFKHPGKQRFLQDSWSLKAAVVGLSSGHIWVLHSPFWA